MINIKSLCIELPGFALQNIDLSIKDGEFFTFLGPTGAGKTLEKLMVQLGLKALAQRSIQHLSGGEKQRVFLAQFIQRSACLGSNSDLLKGYMEP